MSPALQLYLQAVIQANATIDARGVLQMQQMVELMLDEVFVHLTTRLDTSSAAHLYQPNLDTLHLWSISEGLSPADETSCAAEPHYRSEQLPKLEQGLSLEQLWERNHYWILLGDPGAGKTTVLKHLALAHARQYLETEQGLIPIPISLRLFAHAWQHNPAWPMQQALLNYLKSNGFSELSNEKKLLDHAESLVTLLEEALNRLGCILLLDGLDEQHDSRIRYQVNEAIEQFLIQYPSNRCLVSSRIIGYYDAPLHGGFQVATLESFNEAQIQEFFYLWAYAIAKVENNQGSEAVWQKTAIEQADQLLQHIQHTPGVRILATNPLLCTIISLIYRQSGTLPTHRAHLYRLCIETFIFNWEAYKRQKALQAPSLAPAETQDVLEIIALHFHEHCPENRSSANDILHITLHYLEHELGLTSDEAQQKAQQLLHLIRYVAGLLIERGNEIYGFFHLTFQEYLTARAILHKRSTLKHYLDLNLYKARWREVFLLAAAHQGTVSPELGSELIELLLSYQHPRDELMFYTFRFAFACMRETRVKLATANRLLAQWIDLFLTAPALTHLLLSLLSRAGAPLRYQASLLTPLFERLQNDKEAHWRAQIAKALGFFATETSITLLQDCLQHDSHEQVRIQAALSLGRMQANSAIPSLAYALQHDSEEEVRQAAAQALGQIGHPDVLVPLSILLRQPSPPLSAQLQQVAITALGQLPFPEAVATLAQAIQQTQLPALRLAAIHALSHHKTAQAIALLAELLAHDPEANIRLAAAESLGQQRNPTALPVLVSVLNDNPDRQLRCRAAEALGHFRFPFAMHALIKALSQDTQASVRWRCARALGSFRGTPVVTALSEALLSDSDAWVRWQAAEALWQVQDPVAVNVLGHALRHDVDEVVRWRAAEALGHLSGPSAVQALLRILYSDEDSAILWRVAQALGHLRDPTAAIPLSRALQTHPDPGIRRRAAHALANVSQPMAIEALLYALRHDSDSEVRQTAAEALGQLHVEETLNDLIRALREDKDEWVRWRAADAIGHFQTKAAALALQETLLTEMDEWVCWRATEALGRLQHPHAIVVLAEALSRHPDEWVRWRAAEALGNFQHPLASSALLKALQHDHSLAVKQNAATALEKIDIGALL